MDLEAVFFVTFVSLLLAGLLRTVARLLEYVHARKPIPVILWRDVLSRGGTGFPLALILVVRATDHIPVVSGQLWWVIVTSVPAIFGAGVYAYFEFFVIDKREDPWSSRRRSTDE